MQRIYRLTIFALLAGTLAGCIVYSRPCRRDCWWDHGVRVCERRCG